jgi:serine/threonine-protein kinase RsbW
MGERVAESGQSELDDEPDRGQPSGDCGAIFVRTYPAAAGSVAAIRAAVARFAAHAGVAPLVVDAVTLAVSEAATNVVVHAYADAAQPGLIEVEVTYTAGELHVNVGDTGSGLRPGHGRSGLGLGLAIINELADRVEVLQGGESGLRIVMHFAATPEAGCG